MFKPSYSQFLLENIAQSRAKYRRSGSTALDMAYVSSGALDAFWRSPTSAWDVAAGALLIKEAGGFVSDLKGNPDYLEGGSIIAANCNLIKKILPPISQHIDNNT